MKLWELSDSVPNILTINAFETKESLNDNFNYSQVRFNNFGCRHFRKFQCLFVVLVPFLNLPAAEEQENDVGHEEDAECDPEHDPPFFQRMLETFNDDDNDNSNVILQNHLLHVPL